MNYAAKPENVTLRFGSMSRELFQKKLIQKASNIHYSYQLKHFVSTISHSWNIRSTICHVAENGNRNGDGLGGSSGYCGRKRIGISILESSDLFWLARHGSLQEDCMEVASRSWALRIVPCFIRVPSSRFIKCISLTLWACLQILASPRGVEGVHVCQPESCPQGAGLCLP